MKNSILLICLIGLTKITFAQEVRIGDYAPKARRGTYIGLTTGFNNPGGIIGIRVNTNLTKAVLLDFAAGPSLWGNKFSSNFILATDKPKGIVPFVGCSFVTGIKNTTLPTQVVSGPNITATKDLNFNLNQAFVLNLGAQYQWYTKKGNRFFVEGGYSVKISGGDYELLSDGFVLTDEFKSALNSFSPGGLMLGFTYLWVL